MKIVFMGSPEFAVPSLDALIEARHDVSLVVTQPDRRAGRGRKLEGTAVKKAALSRNLSVLEWEKERAKEVTAAVLAEEPDAIVVTAFGVILREPLLSAPPHGCINVHASLLPRWRGVSPIQYAILHGDLWTGVSIMRMDSGVDTGPILSQGATAIAPDENAGELHDRLSGLGADQLVHTLRGIEHGLVSPIVQNDTGAVYAPKLTRSLAPVRWDRDVTRVNNQIRGLWPYPGATSFLGEQNLKITAAHPSSFHTSGDTPGTIVAVDREGIEVACGEGVLRITGIQAPGRRPLEAAQFIQGHEVRPGEIFRS